MDLYNGAEGEEKLEIKSIISITIEMFALLISLLISFFLMINKRRDQKDRIILWMVLLTGILLFSDVMAYHFRGDTSRAGWYIVRISNFLVFTTNYVMLSAYGMCLRLYTGANSKRQIGFLRFVWLMACASVVMLIASQFSSFLYYFDAENFYHRGTMFILTQVAPVVGGVIYVGFLIANRNQIRQNVRNALALYLAMPYLATLFQIFVYGYPAQTVAVVIGCWGICFAREVEIHNRLEESLKQEKEKQDQLERALSTVEEQYSVLKSMSGIYYSMHLIDLANDTVEELNAPDEVRNIVNRPFGAAKMMADIIGLTTTDEYKAEALRFTDLTTLADRMQNRKAITGEFLGNYLGWYRAEFVAIEVDSFGKPTKVVFTTQGIDDEKRQRDTLIRKSQTDELTGFYNRRAYEEDIEKYRNEPIEDDFVYISFDVNSLKTVNDTLGHAAGDELVIGACGCMREAFAAFGKLYRTGGDEFVFIGFADEENLKTVFLRFDETTAKWSGDLVKSLSVSYGVVVKNDAPDASFEEIALIADQKMYAAKRAYYEQSGHDRRRPVS